METVRGLSRIPALATMMNSVRALNDSDSEWDNVIVKLAAEKPRAPRDWVPDTENAVDLQREDEEFLKDLDVEDTPVEIEGGNDLTIFT